jgi:uncharacterized damage-inducible protein DinB
MAHTSMADASPSAALAAIYRGWADHQARLLDVLGPLTDAQVQLRPSPDHWAIWQLASNMAGGRAYWLHEVLGEGQPAVRDMFRVATPTVPDLPLEDAGWEDDENHPRTAAELIHAFEVTWGLLDDCLRRWTEEDLRVEFQRPRRDGRRHTRAWVIWHLLEHELHHGTEIALILRSHGLRTLAL